MTAAHNSKAQNKIVILDSCHSGVAASSPLKPALAEIADGMTVLTASTADQYSMETGGAGVYTTLLVNALNGAAANLLGAVTPGSVYAHIDQSLGPWAQRPVFRTNVTKFISLRTLRGCRSVRGPVEAPLELVHLRQLPVLFSSPTALIHLDPSYEPERPETGIPSAPLPDPTNTAAFAVLQKCAAVGLVRPVGASKPHMYYAAMESKTCELTALGQHYWRLAKERLL